MRKPGNKISDPPSYEKEVVSRDMSLSAVASQHLDAQLRANYSFRQQTPELKTNCVLLNPLLLHEGTYVLIIIRNLG